MGVSSDINDGVEVAVIELIHRMAILGQRTRAEPGQRCKLNSGALSGPRSATPLDAGKCEGVAGRR